MHDGIAQEFVRDFQVILFHRNSRPRCHDNKITVARREHAEESSAVLRIGSARPPLRSGMGTG